jgi:hypothetical protein
VTDALLQARMNRPNHEGCHGFANSAWLDDNAMATCSSGAAAFSSTSTKKLSGITSSWSSSDSEKIVRR